MKVLEWDRDGMKIGKFTKLNIFSLIFLTYLVPVVDECGHHLGDGPLHQHPAHHPGQEQVNIYGANIHSDTVNIYEANILSDTVTVDTHKYNRLGEHVIATSTNALVRMTPAT